MIILLLTVSLAHGQEYFNKRYSLNNLWPTFEYVDIENNMIYLSGQTYVPTSDTTRKWRYHYTALDLKGDVQWTFTPELDSSIFNVYPFGIKVTEKGDIITPHRREGLFVLKYHTETDSFSYNRVDSETNPNDFFVVTEMIELENGNLAFLISESPDSTSDQSDPAIVVMDQDLNVIWSKSYSLTTVHDTPTSIIEDSNKLVVGYNYSNSFFGVRLNKEFRLGVLRVDKNNGNLINSFIVDDTEMHSYPYDLIKDDQGDYYVATSLLTLDTIYLGSRPEERPRTRPQLIKLNRDFEIEWKYTYLSDTILDGNWCTLYHLALAPNKRDVVAAGMINVRNHEVSDSINYFDDSKGILSKFTPDGQHIWTRTFVGIDSGWLYHFVHFVEPSPDGGYLFGGRSVERNTRTTGDPRFAWLVKVDEHGCLVPGCHLPVSVDDPMKSLDIRIHPNPSSDMLNIFQNNDDDIFFRIVDEYGRLVRSFENSTQGETIMLDIMDWPPGKYVLQATSKSGLYWQHVFIKI
jgi:hypothetical protein